MKKLFLILLFLCLAVLPACAEETKIIVATDLHYISPELTDNGPFFTQMVESADGKAMLYVSELCQAFVEEVIAEKPQCLILSGDLTFNGEKQSHLDLAQMLMRVKNAGIPVLVIPGNHDLNTAAHAFHGDDYSSVDSVSAAEFREIYAQLGFAQALSCDTASLSYVYQLAPGWRVVMLDVNTKEAPGRVHAETLAWLEAQLNNAKAENQRVIAVSHQNLLGHNALFTSGYVIGGSEELQALYADAPVVCNFSGHIHMQHAVADAQTPEIVTSSLVVSPNQYGIVTLGDQLTYHTKPVDVSAWAAKQGLQDENLLQFAVYSEQFFKTTAYWQAIFSISMPTEDKEGMAQWFADLNACYFAGRMDLVETESPYWNLWDRQPSFVVDYAASMLEEELKDHTQVVLPIE